MLMVDVNGEIVSAFSTMCGLGESDFAQMKVMDQIQLGSGCMNKELCVPILYL